MESLYSVLSSMEDSSREIISQHDDIIARESSKALTSLVDELYKELAAPRQPSISCPKWGKIDLKTWMAPCPWHRRYLAASKLLYKASYRRRLGFGMLILYGIQGAGKTVLSLIAAHEVFCLIGRRKTMKRIIDDYLVFGPDELKEKAANASPKRRYPVIIGDDWGITASGMMWFEDREFYIWLRKLMQVVRTRIANLIVTTANLRALMSTVAGQPGVIVGMVRPLTGDVSMVTYYEYNILPSGRVYLKKVGSDVYCVTMPDEVYDYYLQRRDSYVDYVLNSGSR